MLIASVSMCNRYSNKASSYETTRYWVVKTTRVFGLMFLIFNLDHVKAANGILVYNNDYDGQLFFRCYLEFK